MIFDNSSSRTFIRYISFNTNKIRLWCMALCSMIYKKKEDQTQFLHPNLFAIIAIICSWKSHWQMVLCEYTVNIYTYIKIYWHIICNFHITDVIHEHTKRCHFHRHLINYYLKSDTMYVLHTCIGSVNMRIATNL